MNGDQQGTLSREKLLALMVSQLHYYGMPAAAEVVAATAMDKGISLQWVDPSSELLDLCALGMKTKEEGGTHL